MNTGKINFKYTPEQIELVKKMGSNNRSEALAAQEALAAVITPKLLEVVETAPTLGNLYKTIPFMAGTPAALPLDTMFDVRHRNYLNVTTQAQPGGVATNFVQGLSEMFINTHNLDSAVSFNKNYAKAGRLDVVADTLQRLAQEILVKEELEAANIMLAALAAARIDGTSSTAVTNLQVVRSYTAGRFQLDDFNTLMTKYARTMASWTGGTPIGQMNQLTDLIGSPEFFGFVRSISYQPQNISSGAVTTSGASSLAAPESVREQIFRSGGIPTLFDVALIQSYDLGIGRAYNTLFSNYAGSTAYVGTAGSGTAVFAPTTEQLVIGLNRNVNNLVKLREIGDSGALNLMPDDTFTTRSEKIGFYCKVKQGMVSLDARGSIGMLI